MYENDRVVAFDDINPQAPVHVLIIHKKHIKNIDELTAENGAIMSDIFLAIKEVAAIKDRRRRYRVIINNGAAAAR